MIELTISTTIGFCISILVFTAWFLFFRNPKIDKNKIVAQLDELTVYESDILRLKESGIKCYMLKVRGLDLDILKMVNRFKGLNWIICIKVDLDIMIIKNVMDSYTNCAGVKAFYLFNDEMDIIGNYSYFQKLSDIYSYYIIRRRGCINTKKIIVEVNSFCSPYLSIPEESIFEDICDLKSFLYPCLLDNIKSESCLYVNEVMCKKDFKKFLKKIFYFFSNYYNFGFYFQAI